VQSLPPIELSVEAAFRKCINDAMDGEKGAKSMLDQFLEHLSTLAYLRVLEDGKHYKRVEELTCIHLPSAWDLHLEHCRRTGKVEDPGNLRALQRQIDENHRRGGYVKEVNKTVNLNGGRPRTFAIDMREAQRFLDVEEFPGVAHSHGGAPPRARPN
jgi:hypothetical protein